MCQTCWEKDGAHCIDSPKVHELAEAMSQADDYGPLHIVIADDNLEDGNLKWCRDNVPLPWPDADERCYHLLVAATFEERVSANGLYQGFWLAAPEAR